jgi:hypothetical protein
MSMIVIGHIAGETEVRPYDAMLTMRCTALRVGIADDRASLIDPAQMLRPYDDIGCR